MKIPPSLQKRGKKNQMPVTNSCGQLDFTSCLSEVRREYPVGLSKKYFFLSDILDWSNRFVLCGEKSLKPIKGEGVKLYAV